MREAIVGFFMVLLFEVVQLTSATVVFKPLSVSFPDLPAKFAPSVDGSGICGALHVADPPQACSLLRNRFESNGTEQVRFALIVRGECAFEDKIRNAQNGGFRAALVYDDRDKRNLVYMMVNPEGLKVHAIFVSKATGEILKERRQGKEGECCIYPAHSDTAWTVLAISFISLLLIFTFLMIAVVTPSPRNWLNWHQSNFNTKSVDARTVEALPRLRFCSAHSSLCHSGETCAICLEDYKDGEVLKILPCRHEFHSSCVDSWLTKWGTFCPVCKLDIRTKFAYSKIKWGISLEDH